jgi:energy-coupling factor transporter ATP-binding protein EcfA2
MHGVSVIYGKTGSGKSTVIKHLMHVLKDNIDVCIVVSPSEPSNATYSEIIDAPMIHYSILNGDLLKNIISWQEMRANLYKKTMDMTILKSLYHNVPNSGIDASIAKTISRMNAVLSSIEDITHSIKIKQDFDDLLLKIYKPYLISKKHILRGREIYSKLSKDEQYAVEYIDINPNILLILDDCAAELKPIFGKDTFRTIFYNGRHSYITVMLCCQDDTDLPTNLRKNAKLTIFTDPIVAASNFERSSNKYPKYIQVKIKDATQTIFKDNRKLVYDGKDVYHFTASVFPPFYFGSPLLKTLCKELAEGSDTMNVNNPFYQKFKL